jgi:hypothetical protein
MGVLLGMGALTLDVGNMMFERRQLQNGADAAALELASICANDSTACSVTDSATLNAIDTINGLNASDDKSARDGTRLAGNSSGICGANLPTGSYVPGCPTDAVEAPASKWLDCPALPEAWADGVAPWVQVYTLTATASSTGVLRSFLGGADSSPGACARVGWSAYSPDAAFPLTINECEFDEVIGDDESGYGAITTIPLKYKKASSCVEDTAPSGGDFNGGFGWVAHDMTCMTAEAVPGWNDADTGVGAGNDCIKDLELGKVYLLPIYTCISDTDTLAPCSPPDKIPGGTNTFYHLGRFVAFKLLAYNLTSTGGWVPDPPPDGVKAECSSESKGGKCIAGYFIKDYVVSGGSADPTKPPTGDGEPIVLDPIG